MTRPQVLHVYKDYYPVLGGIENHIRLLATRLAAGGNFDVTVLVANLRTRTVVEEVDGVRLIKAGRLRTIASTPISLALFREMAKLRPSLVHLHFPYPLGELAYLACGRRTPMVLTYHSDIVRQQNLLRVYRPFLRRVLARAERILVTSRVYAESSPHLAPHLDRCRLVPFGVDLDRFAPTPAVLAQAAAIRHAAIRAIPGDPDTPPPTPPGDPLRDPPGRPYERVLGDQIPLLLFVGRLRYYKGLEYLLAAMREVDARLLIVGDGPAGPALRVQAAAGGRGERVVFAGEVPEADLPAYYHAADVFVLPSSHRSEAFGIVQLEAMAAGLPVVCTDLGTGTTFVNQDGETGLVVPPQDPPALAAALRRLLAAPDWRARLGAGARRRVEAEFSLAAMVRRVEQIYLEVLGQ